MSAGSDCNQMQTIFQQAQNVQIQKAGKYQNTKNLLGLTESQKNRDRCTIINQKIFHKE